MTTNYRPEVDGLRAIAVIPVILFHAGFEWFSGGYIGVDVFFVVSGYLITGIIYGEMQQDQFSIIKFYERRARRILPALTFVSLISLVVAWRWMLPEEFKSLSESLVAVNLFVSNIYFWQDMGYFDGPAELKPFLHTWSLAVEEQFYLFFPLFMLLIARFKKVAVLSILCLGFMASLALAEWGSETHPSANFYLLPTRAWELLAGAIIAIYLHNRAFNPSGMLSNLMAGSGLALVMLAIVFFDETVPFPSLWAVVPVLGTSLVILYANTRNMVGQLLSLKPMVGIGLISYSAYLWHQPVFAFAREMSFAPLTQVDFLQLSILSLLLAWFSWWFVEQPFRNKQLVSRPQIFKASLTVSCLMIGFGVYGINTQGIPWRFNDDIQMLSEVRSHKFINSGDCNSTPGNMRSIEDACMYNSIGDSKVVVWGDSQATPLIGPVAERVDGLGMQVKQLVYTNCLPISDYTRHDDSDCGKFNQLAMDYMIGNADVEMVVMLGRYPFQFEGEVFDNGEGGTQHERTIYAVPYQNNDTGLLNETEQRIEVVGGLLRNTVDKLVADGKKVILIYPVPEVGWDVPYFLAREKLRGIERDAPLSTSYEVFKERTATTYEQFSVIDGHTNLLKIDPASIFCNSYLPGRCAVEISGKMLYYDDNHLSRYGAEFLIEHVFEQIIDKGWLHDRTENMELAKQPENNSGNEG
ncbi:acyltransferase family protein [Halomonas sp. HK25]|uniref:acyltransferase family protein n=1 Tax=Halomonas sp. HK25 TaxID=3394321 RepID=UPI0039FBFFB8